MWLEKDCSGVMQFYTCQLVIRLDDADVAVGRSPVKDRRSATQSAKIGRRRDELGLSHFFKKTTFSGPYIDNRRLHKANGQRKVASTSCPQVKFSTHLRALSK